MDLLQFAGMAELLVVIDLLVPMESDYTNQLPHMTARKMVSVRME